MDKARVIRYCDRAIEIALCAVVFYIPISNALIESFAGVAIAAWLIKKIVSGQFSSTRIFPRDFMSLPVWLYIAALFLSVVDSSARLISFKFFIFKTVEYLLLFFIASDIKDKRVLRNVLIFFVFSTFLVCFDGVQQYFTGFDFLRGRPQVIDRRINGPFTTPNDFSNYIVAVLPVVACFSLMKFRRGWLRTFLAGLSVVLLLCLVLSATRAAWLAAVAVLPMFLLMRQRRLFVIGVLAIVGAVIFMPFLSQFAQSRIDRFLLSSESSFFHRSMLWRMSLDMLVEKPFFGQGLGTFMFNFERFKPGQYPYFWEISYAHNCFLQMLAETGIFGFLSFVSVVSTLLYAVFRRAWSMARSNRYFIITGLWFGLTAYLIHSFFDTSLYSLPLTVMFWMMMGLTVAAIRISE